MTGMKTKTLLLFTALAAAAAAQQTQLDIKVPDTVESDLFGPVKSTRTVYEKERFLSSTNRHSTYQYDQTYDEKGNQLTYVYIDLDDSTTNVTTCLYDSDGCLTGKVYNAADTETNTVYSYTIDVPSRQILRINHKTDDRRVTVYTPQGYEYYIEDRDRSNTVESVTRIKRQPDHKEYELHVVDGDGEPIRSSYMEWNTSGLMRKYRYHRPGTNEYTTITRYTHPKKDERGNWLKLVKRQDRIYEGKKEAYSETIAIREIEYYEE